MAEGSCDDNAEEKFIALEKEILVIFDQVLKVLDEKRKQILDSLAKFREEYNTRNEKRLKKIKELNQMKCKLRETDSHDNEVMELRENALHKIESRISQFILPDEFPNLVFKHDINEIIAKFDTFQLVNIGDDSLDIIDTRHDSDIMQSMNKLPSTMQVHDTFRRMSLHRENTQTRPITDIKIISSKSQVPVGYSTLESTADGKAVQLWESWFRVFGTATHRFLCYTRQTMDAMRIREGTTKWSRTEVPLEDQIVVTDIRIASTTTHEFLPRDYEVLEKTLDTNELALNQLNLLIKYEKKVKTDIAVSQLMFLQEAQIKLLPPKFCNVSLPMNGYYLCFNSDKFVW